MHQITPVPRSMIIRSALSHSDGHVITLRPNGSLRWRAAKWACAGLALLVGGVAAWFAAQGAWLVLPFAGAELLVVGAGLYLSCRASRFAEVIHVGPETLVVQHGHGRPEQEHAFQRAWARVVLVRDPSGWYPSRLLVRSHGRSVEIGARLVEEERLELAEELARLTRTAATFDPTLPRAASPARPRSVPT